MSSNDGEPIGTSETRAKAEAGASQQRKGSSDGNPANLGLSSHDDLDAALLVGEPDPLLQPSPSVPNLDDLANLGQITTAAVEPIETGIELDGHPNRANPAESLVQNHSGGSSLESFSAIELGTIGEPPRAPSMIDQEAASTAEDLAEEEESPSRGGSLLVLLLASYASAVTLGLAWVLLSGRKLDRLPAAENPPEASSLGAEPVDPGIRADHSRIVVDSPSIPPSQRTPIGKSLRLGDLEVTPLKVVSGPVVLVRTLGDRQTSKGGEQALKLRIRIQNVSTSQVFAPLDEAFLRQRLRAEPDSFIETANGKAAIDLYPLAVSSEWSIVGQEFVDLRPGGAFETWIVSEAHAVDKLEDEMVWRIRLRIGIDKTLDLGVPFRSGEVSPESKRQNREMPIL